MFKEIMMHSISMSTINRYSQSHIMRIESVMEHTGFVTMFCIIIAMKHGSISIENVAKKAIIHDMEEGHIGDIARPTKYANENIKREIENVAKNEMRKISSDIIDDDRLFIEWEHSKDDTIEGRLVALADIASVIMKIYEETIIYNNRVLFNHIFAIKDHLIGKAKDESDDFLKILIDEMLIVCSNIIGD